jgi:putative ABC transport system permease protein
MSSTDTADSGTIIKPRSSGMPLVLRFALRELRAGLSGFYVFIACVALGVAVITGVGALGDALKSGFESQGQAILGGDVTFARAHKRADPAELAWMTARGRVSARAGAGRAEGRRCRLSADRGRKAKR